MAKKLLEQLAEALHIRHYSYRTEEAYVDWVRRYILFHKKRHPASMGVEEIREFLAHLAEERNVAASTHTAPAVGAGGIRQPVPSCSCTAKSCIRSSNRSCLRVPNVRNACRPC